MPSGCSEAGREQKIQILATYDKEQTQTRLCMLRITHTQLSYHGSDSIKEERNGKITGRTSNQGLILDECRFPHENRTSHAKCEWWLQQLKRNGRIFAALPICRFPASNLLHSYVFAILNHQLLYTFISTYLTSFLLCSAV